MQHLGLLLQLLRARAQVAGVVGEDLACALEMAIAHALQIRILGAVLRLQQEMC